MRQAEYEAIQAARLDHASPEGQQRYKRRAGVEGTISQGVRALGLRRTRYRGLSKEHHRQSSTAQMPQLEALYALRDRILFELKLGKQATGYKVALKALNRFIAEFTTRA